ncbi:retrovirus-related pol polyprotein from transposon TNT 1-94 [Tanacetum coccineum]
MDNRWQEPITHEITVLVKNLLIPLAIKTKVNDNEFERDLKQEMFEDLEYIQSLENEVDELESEKAEFLNEYVLLLQECVSKDIMCSIMHSLVDIDEQTKLQYLYLEKIVECERLANRTNHPIHGQLECTKHMTGNLKLLCNFVEKYLGTVRFRNDQFALIIGYGDLVQGNITIKRIYYVEGLSHNLFSVGQFYDADLEVAFRKSTCFVRDLQGNDLLTGTRGCDLYTISLQETSSPTPICFMVKASPTQAWLWHRRLSHLNFDTINLLSKNEIVNGLPKLKFVKDQLCPSCELSKSKRSSFKTKTVPSSKGRFNLLHMDLCGPMWIEIIKGKKYIMPIVDNYS